MIQHLNEHQLRMAGFAQMLKFMGNHPIGRKQALKMMFHMRKRLKSLFGKKSPFLPFTFMEEHAFTPEKIFPMGIDSTRIENPYSGEVAEARKGTVAATLNNVALLNKLLMAGHPQEIKEVINAIQTLMTSLKAIGVFNLFTPMEWLTTEDQQGRILAAVLFLQTHPAEMTLELASKLKGLQEQTRSPYLAQEIAKVLAAQTKHHS